jgi:predicted transcriptional regulator
MKIAISIPDDLSINAERLVADFKTSRSELYSRAIAEFAARHEEDAVTQTLDEVARKVNSDPSDMQIITASALTILRQVAWWFRRAKSGGLNLMPLLAPPRASDDQC